VIEDRPVYALGDEQWNIPALRLLLENIALQQAVMEGYDVEGKFPEIGRGTESTPRARPRRAGPDRSRRALY